MHAYLCVVVDSESEREALTRLSQRIKAHGELTHHDRKLVGKLEVELGRMFKGRGGLSFFCVSKEDEARFMAGEEWKLGT